VYYTLVDDCFVMIHMACLGGDMGPYINTTCHQEPTTHIGAQNCVLVGPIRDPWASLGMAYLLLLLLACLLLLLRLCIVKIKSLLFSFKLIDFGFLIYMFRNNLKYKVVKLCMIQNLHNMFD
jgi:hypothetical protein